MNYSGWARATTSLRGLLSARHLVWECGPNRNKRRTETTARREGERKDLFLSGGGETQVGVDLPPSWFIAQSAFTANGFVFAGPMHAYLRHESASTCIVPRLSLFLRLSPSLYLPFFMSLLVFPSSLGLRDTSPYPGMRNIL